MKHIKIVPMAAEHLDRLEQLEQKVNRHNHVIERQYELEKRFAEHERDYAAACHRIRELEKGA